MEAIKEQWKVIEQFPNVDNLEWCTRSENMKHAYSIGHGRWK